MLVKRSYVRCCSNENASSIGIPIKQIKLKLEVIYKEDFNMAMNIYHMHKETGLGMVLR